MSLCSIFRACNNVCKLFSMMSKRKIAESTLQRRVRPRWEDEVDSVSTSAASEESEAVEEVDISNETEEGQENETFQKSSDHDDNLGNTTTSESESSQPETAAELKSGGASSISFGALAKAQENMQTTKKSRKSKKALDDPQWENEEATERQGGRRDHREFSRISKHAPTELSSKKAVTRKREVLPVTKRSFRDPRFDPLSGNLDESKAMKAYSFLDNYREGEITELKTAIKATKDEELKDGLKRALLSMESKKKAQARKLKEKEALDRHRLEEKELVKQGKKPFFLKKSEQKKRVLIDQYQGLKGKQLDRVIERRRKKVEGKEKKQLPISRRNFDQQ